MLEELRLIGGGLDTMTVTFDICTKTVVMPHLIPRGSIMILFPLILALFKPKTGTGMGPTASCIGYDRQPRKRQQLWNSSVEALTAYSCCSAVQKGLDALSQIVPRVGRLGDRIIPRSWTV